MPSLQNKEPAAMVGGVRTREDCIRSAAGVYAAWLSTSAAAEAIAAATSKQEAA